MKTAYVFLLIFALLSSSAYGIQTLPLVNEEEIIAQVKVDNHKNPQKTPTST